MGIQLLPVVVVMYAWAVEHNKVTFSDLSVAVIWRKRLP